MAWMIPRLSEAQLAALESAAEAKVYRAFRDNLPDAYTVYHSTGWVLRREGDGGRDGETDFIVTHPENGFVTLEVKGGGIGYEAGTGAWYSVDRNQRRHAIKDPVRQALQAKYSILAKLREHPRWPRLGLRRVLCGHGVFFPDISNSGPLQRPDLPATLIGTRLALNNPEQWLEALFAYWRGDDPGTSGLGRAGLELFESIFARSFEVRPLLADTLAEEEQKRIQLTEEQVWVLDMLQTRRRVAVSGGAGTGKTVLAVEKARRLASEGFRTLLTCYNRPLAEHLAAICRNIERLKVTGFHQLCVQWIDRAKEQTDRDLLQEAKLTYPGSDEWHVQYPNALSYAAEILEDRYDAIVCDEGQDFGEDYWLPLEMLLTNAETSPLYVFFDDNQNLYHRSGTFPIRDEPFPLTKNCRNTDRIHEAAYHYYQGIPVMPPGIDGREIETITESTISDQAKSLKKKIVELLSREGINPTDIVVLVIDARRKGSYYETLSNYTLPGSAHWRKEGRVDGEDIQLDTVNRYKGLEASVVFLWGFDSLEPVELREAFYVGMSRAKSLLYLVGNDDACRRLLSS